MKTPAYGNNAYTLHEARIIALEDNVSDIKAETSSQTVKLDNIQETLSKLDDKIESLSDINKRLNDLEGTRKRAHSFIKWLGSTIVLLIGWVIALIERHR